MRHWTMATAFTLGSLIAVTALAGGGTGDSGEVRALRQKVTRLERQVSDMRKIVTGLEKAQATAKKDAASTTKALEKVNSRFDKRTLLLADWFDAHHERESYGRYHREQIRRIK